MTEPWLRGSIPGIPDLLQPAAHALVLAKEDVDAATAGLTAYIPTTLRTSPTLTMRLSKRAPRFNSILFFSTETCSVLLQEIVKAAAIKIRILIN